MGAVGKGIGRLTTGLLGIKKPRIPDAGAAPGADPSDAPTGEIDPAAREALRAQAARRRLAQSGQRDLEGTGAGAEQNESLLSQNVEETQGLLSEASAEQDREIANERERIERDRREKIRRQSAFAYKVGKSGIR